MSPGQERSEAVLRQSAIETAAATFGGVAAEGAALLASGSGAGFVAAAAAPILSAAAALTFSAMSRRGQVRVGGVMAAAVAAIGDYPLRDDGFFTEDHTGRSAAAEAVEAVLRIAEKDPQERKVPHLGHLLGCLATETFISRDGASWFVRVAGELSWNQYVLLSLIPAPDTDGVSP